MQISIADRDEGDRVQPNNTTAKERPRIKPPSSDHAFKAVPRCSPSKPMWIVHRTHEQNHVAVVIKDGEEEGTIHDHLEEMGFGSGPG